MTVWLAGWVVMMGGRFVSTITVKLLVALNGGNPDLKAVIDAIAGGGTILTFPVLLALGLDGKTANVTSTLGLWPGSLGGAWGLRRDLAAEVFRQRVRHQLCADE